MKYSIELSSKYTYWDDIIPFNKHTSYRFEDTGPNNEEPKFFFRGSEFNGKDYYSPNIYNPDGWYCFVKDLDKPPSECTYFNLKYSLVLGNIPEAASLEAKEKGITLFSIQVVAL